MCVKVDIDTIFCELQLGSHPVAAVQYTFTHKQYTGNYNQTEYNTYITTKIHKHTIRIHKLYNKDT